MTPHIEADKGDYAERGAAARRSRPRRLDRQDLLRRAAPGERDQGRARLYRQPIAACRSACRRPASGVRRSPSTCTSCSRSTASGRSCGSAVPAASTRRSGCARWSSPSRRRWISRSKTPTRGGGRTRRSATTALALAGKAAQGIEPARWCRATCSTTAIRWAVSPGRGRAARLPATWRRPRSTAWPTRFGARALSICTVVDSLVTGEEIDKSERQEVFGPMAELALETLAADWKPHGEPRQLIQF